MNYLFLPARPLAASVRIVACAAPVCTRGRNRPWSGQWAALGAHCAVRLCHESSWWGAESAWRLAQRKGYAVRPAPQWELGPRAKCTGGQGEGGASAALEQATIQG